MLISVGHKNFVQAALVKLILRPNRPLAKDWKLTAEATGMIIDATSGRKARSVIVLKDDHVVLSALETSAIEKRMGMFVRNLNKDERQPQLYLFDGAEKGTIGGL